VSNSRFSRRRLLTTFSVLAGAGALSALSAACGQSPSPQQPSQQAPSQVEVTRVVEKVITASPAPQSQVIQLKLSTDFNGPGRKEIIDVMAQDFQKQNPNVKLDVWHLGSGGTSGPGGTTDVVVAQLLTGTAADVIGNVAWGPYVSYLMDLSKDAPQAGWKKDEQVYDPWHQEVNGKLFGLNMNASIGGWAYNKTMFEQAGLKEPDDTWTFDDVLIAAQKLTDPSKHQYGIQAVHSPWFGWLEPLWQAGAGSTKSQWTANPTAQMFSPEEKKTRLAEASAPDMFEWYIDLMYKYKVAPTPGETPSLTAGSISDPFAAGHIGMKPFPDYNAASAATLIGDRFKWSLMPIPKHQKTGMRAYDLNSDTWVIPQVTQKRGTYDMALKLALSYYSDTVEKAVAQYRGTMPVVKKWAASPEYTRTPPDNMKVISDELNDPQIIIGDHQGEEKAFGPWMDAVNRELDKAFTGDVPGKDALMAAVKAGDAILAKSS